MCERTAFQKIGNMSLIDFKNTVKWVSFRSTHYLFCNMIKQLFSLPMICMMAFAATAQPTQAFRDSLNMLLDYSHDGFKKFRYNEKEKNEIYNYQTILSLPGFSSSYVQIASTKLYKQNQFVKKAVFFAKNEFNANEPALQSTQKLVSDILQSVKVSGIDSTFLGGFKKHYVFLVKKDNQPAITIETGLLSEPGFFQFIKIISENATDEKGIMDSPPESSSVNYSYSDVNLFISAMIEFSRFNFSKVTGEIVNGAKWSPTYTSKVKFRDFESPKIEYITNTLWNDYITSKNFSNEADARKLFNELTSEFDRNISKYSMRKYQTGDANRNLWYINHGLVDNEGAVYHNTIRLELKKIETGYMIELNFNKFEGK